MFFIFNLLYKMQIRCWWSVKEEIGIACVDEVFFLFKFFVIFLVNPNFFNSYKIIKIFHIRSNLYLYANVENFLNYSNFLEFLDFFSFNMENDERFCLARCCETKFWGKYNFFFFVNLSLIFHFLNFEKKIFKIFVKKIHFFTNNYCEKFLWKNIMTLFFQYFYCKNNFL